MQMKPVRGLHAQASFAKEISTLERSNHCIWGLPTPPSHPPPFFSRLTQSHRPLLAHAVSHDSPCAPATASTSRGILLLVTGTGDCAGKISQKSAHSLMYYHYMIRARIFENSSLVRIRRGCGRGTTHTHTHTHTQSHTHI